MNPENAVSQRKLNAEALTPAPNFGVSGSQFEPRATPGEASLSPEVAKQLCSTLREIARQFETNQSEFEGFSLAQRAALRSAADHFSLNILQREFNGRLCQIAVAGEGHVKFRSGSLAGEQLLRAFKCRGLEGIKPSCWSEKIISGLMTPLWLFMRYSRQLTFGLLQGSTIITALKDYPEGRNIMLEHGARWSANTRLALTGYGIFMSALTLSIAGGAVSLVTGTNPLSSVSVFVESAARYSCLLVNTGMLFHLLLGDNSTLSRFNPISRGLLYDRNRTMAARIGEEFENDSSLSQMLVIAGKMHGPGLTNLPEESYGWKRWTFENG